LTTIQQLAGLGLRITSALAFLPPLLTRLLVGIGLHYTGHGKLQHLDRTTSFFSELGIPFPYANAVFVSSLEFVGGLFIVLGFGTRIFSAMLCCTLLVAVLTADRGTFVEKWPADLTDVASFVYLLFLLWLVVFGPGPVSIDRFLSKWLGIGQSQQGGAQ
jgi:putative oxidoreductase